MAEVDIKTPIGLFGKKDKSESRYLNDRLDVKSARSKLQQAQLKLTQAQKGFAATPSTSKVYQASADAVKRAQAALEEAKIEVEKIEASAKADYQKAYKKVSAKKEKAEAQTIDKQIEVETAYLQRLKDSGQSISAQEAKIQDLVDKKNKTGKYAPKPETGAVVGDQGGKTETRNYVAESLGAAKLVRAMSAKERQDLSELLSAAGYYKGPITGVYNDALVAAYQGAITANQARSLAWGEEISWGQFLEDKIGETTALKSAGGVGGLGKPTGTQNISTPLEAAAKVEDIFKAELGRLPTAEESAKYSAELIAEEKKTSSIIKATPKKIGGVTVNVYTGGLDKDQFLANKIRKLPEFSQRKTDARKLNLQDLAKTAAANGFDLMKDFGLVAEGWAKKIENGEDVDTFKNIIRQTAKLGLPDKVGALIDQGVDLDVIYAPYKRIMAATLELDPASIKLDDPVLRSAIGPDREMTTFDFKRALRKDSRWQYTDQAREDVSTAALGILRDFGFTG